MIENLARLIGADVNALKIFVAIFATFPLSLIWSLIFTKRTVGQDLFAVAAGTGIGYFLYGSDVLKLICAIVAVWSVLKVCPNRKLGA